MNQQQRRYLMKRIEEISFNKKREIDKKHTDQGYQLNTSEIFQALAEGRFEVKEKKDNVNYQTIRAFVSFPEERPYHRDFNTIERLWAEVDKKRKDLEDVVMIGDSEEALELLKEFEQGE